MTRIQKMMLAMAVTTMLVAGAPDSQACSCMQPTVYTSYNMADDVVVARVVLGIKVMQHQWYVVRVRKAFKGCYKAGQWAFVRTAASSAACGMTLKEGSTYLLNAGSVETAWGATVMGINLCAYNKTVGNLTATDRQWLMGRYNCCGKQCVCVGGGAMVACKVNPCDVSDCPNGTCQANYCGGCNAEFFGENGALYCGPCTTDNDCGWGQHCSDDNGICVSTCKSDKDCNEGFWCSPTQDEKINECRAYQEEGDYCGGFVPEWSQNKCKPGLTCTDIPKFVADAGGKCRKPCKSGDDCNKNQYCGSGGFCRLHGDCFTPGDCNDENNIYMQPKCLGHGVCENDSCKWQCGPPFECADLEGVYFGSCDAVLGYGMIKGKCAAISGCENVGYSLFDSMEECQKGCIPK